MRSKYRFGSVGRDVPGLSAAGACGSAAWGACAPAGCGERTSPGAGDKNGKYVATALYM